MLFRNTIVTSINSQEQKLCHLKQKQSNFKKLSEEKITI